MLTTAVQQNQPGPGLKTGTTLYDKIEKGCVFPFHLY